MEVQAAPGAPSEKLRPSDEAALLTLGRLLLVALGAGALIGGLTAQLLVGWSYSEPVFLLGALIGMPVALVVQLLNAFGLYVTHRLRSDLDRSGMRVALVPVPTLAAIAIAAAFALGLQDGSRSGVLLYVVPAALSGITAWVAGPWCLAPLFTTSDHSKD